MSKINSIFIAILPGLSLLASYAKGTLNDIQVRSQSSSQLISFVKKNTERCYDKIGFNLLPLKCKERRTNFKTLQKQKLGSRHKSVFAVKTAFINFEFLCSFVSLWLVSLAKYTYKAKIFQRK